MTRDDTIRMAREAGFENNGLGWTYTQGYLAEHLEKFAALVAAAEREKYNELLMAVGKKFPDESRHETALRYIREAESKSDCAAARARGEK